MKEVNPKKMWFTFGNGNEFKGDVKKLLNEKGAEIHLNDPKSLNSKNTMGLIERFNKTVLNKMRKYMTVNDTVKYYDAIPDIIENYNKTVHSATKKTPYSILKGKQVPLIELYDSDIVRDDYKIGDYVRFQKKNKTFDKKGFIPTYSLNVHQIVGKKGRDKTLMDQKIIIRQAQQLRENIDPVEERVDVFLFRFVFGAQKRLCLLILRETAVRVTPWMNTSRVCNGFPCPPCECEILDELCDNFLIPFSMFQEDLPIGRVVGFLYNVFEKLILYLRREDFNHWN